jgi:cytochrome c-type biogenesis protein CcmH/NrfG
MTDFLFDHARRAYDDRSFERANDLLERVVKGNADHGRAWELLGIIAWRLGHRERAQPCLETASLLVPLGPEAACALGECFAATGRRELARMLFQRAADDRRATLEILLMAAAGADAIDFPSLSLRACRAAIQSDPDSPQAHYDLGYYVGRVGGPASTVEAAARKAIQLAPDRLQYRLGLASFLHKHGKTQSAYEVVQHITAAQIEGIGCLCCLKRMVELFDAVNDGERAAWCRERLGLLDAEESSTGAVPGIDPEASR